MAALTRTAPSEPSMIRLSRFKMPTAIECLAPGFCNTMVP